MKPGLFRTPDVAPGPHVLKVTLYGGPGQMPLTLDGIYVLNGTTSNVPDGSQTTQPNGSSTQAPAITGILPSNSSAFSAQRRDILIGGTRS